MLPRPAETSMPSFVKGRKGHVSVVDCMVQTLWRTNDGGWPERTFEELRATVSTMQGYHVTSSTIRSSVYQYPTLFERVEAKNGSLRWKLTKQGRNGTLA